MKGKKTLVVLLIILISIAIIAVIGMLVLKKNTVINQGAFRVNDCIVKSALETDEQEKLTQETTGLADITLNLSQTNTISLLITKEAEATEMYLDEIKISNPNLLGKLYMVQGSLDEIFEIDSDLKRVKITPSEQDGQYLVEIYVGNENFKTNVKIPDNVDVVTFDGSLLKLLDVKIEDLEFEIKFNLNIIDVTGKKNICKVSVKVPDATLITNGIALMRLNVSDYIFQVSN